MADIKGLDEFAKKFLGGQRPEEGASEILVTGKGQKASDAALAAYYKEYQTDFIARAGSFTEDLVAFVVEQRKIRNLTDHETIFGLALANINLRFAWGNPQGSEKKLTPEERDKLLEQFDEVCFGAQSYWDANQ